MSRDKNEKGSLQFRNECSVRGKCAREGNLQGKMSATIKYSHENNSEEREEISSSPADDRGVSCDREKW